MEISEQQAFDCLESDDLIGIGMEADAVRRRVHPERVVTYAVQQSIPLDLSSQTQHGLKEAAEFQHIADAVAAGATAICLKLQFRAGGDTGLHTLGEVEELLGGIRQSFPALPIQAFSTGEILELAAASGLELDEVLARLCAAGLDALSCSDLPDLIQTENSSASFDSWLRVQRAAHRAGARTCAGLIFGAGETREGLVKALFAIRALQRETGGFLSFTLRSSRPFAGAVEEPTAVEYLRLVAVSRIVLEAIPSIESDCVIQGLKVTQMALRFGANDAGTLPAASYGRVRVRRPAFTEEDLRLIVRDAGFEPFERDPLYRMLLLSN